MKKTAKKSSNLSKTYKKNKLFLMYGGTNLII